MARPTLIPFRWVGGRVDVRAHTRGDELLFVATDVVKALKLRLEYVRATATELEQLVYPMPTCTVDELTDDAGRPLEFFTVDQVRELEADRPAYLVDDDFADWFDELMASLSGDELARVLDNAKPLEPGRHDLLEGNTYSVKQAAQILSRDPKLSFTETSLFATLGGYMNWIHRVDGQWTPNIEQLRAGTLVRNPRRITGPKTTYLQVRITPAGLEALLAHFAGADPLHLEPTAHPTLTILEDQA